MGTSYLEVLRIAPVHRCGEVLERDRMGRVADDIGRDSTFRRVAAGFYEARQKPPMNVRWSRPAAGTGPGVLAHGRHDARARRARPDIAARGLPGGRASLPVAGVLAVPATESGGTPAAASGGTSRGLMDMSVAQKPGTSWITSWTPGTNATVMRSSPISQPTWCTETALGERFRQSCRGSALYEQHGNHVLDRRPFQLGRSCPRHGRYAFEWALELRGGVSPLIAQPSSACSRWARWSRSVRFSVSRSASWKAVRASWVRPSWCRKSPRAAAR